MWKTGVAWIHVLRAFEVALEAGRQVVPARWLPLTWNATMGLGMTDTSLLGLISKGTTKLGTMLGSGFRCSQWE